MGIGLGEAETGALVFGLWLRQNSFYAMSQGKSACQSTKEFQRPKPKDQRPS
jgi:hypothetical protein